MIELNKIKIAETELKTFTLLNDGFIPSGFVQMECRLSENYLKGDNSFFIIIEDDEVSKNGNYSPLEMNKKELKQFIDYLKDCYKEMP